MDTLLEAALIFGPQIIFVILMFAFFKQDMETIFYITTSDNIKQFRFINKTYLYFGTIMISIIIFLYSIFGYILGNITDYYQVTTIIFGSLGLYFLGLTVVNYFHRNIRLVDSVLTEKKRFKAIGFEIKHITSVQLVENKYRTDIVIVSNDKRIMIDIMCSNVCTLLYQIGLHTNVLQVELVEKLMEISKLYHRHKEQCQTIVEVIKHD